LAVWKQARAIWLGDVADRDGIETVLVEQLLGCLDDALPRLALLAFYERPGRGHARKHTVAGCRPTRNTVCFGMQYRDEWRS
jgi:hypothetical protein